MGHQVSQQPGVGQFLVKLEAGQQVIHRMAIVQGGQAAVERGWSLLAVAARPVRGPFRQGKRAARAGMQVAGEDGEAAVAEVAVPRAALPAQDTMPGIEQ